MSSIMPPLKVREVDNSPQKRPIFEIIFPNNTLSISGTSAEVDFSAAVLNYNTDIVNNNTGNDLLAGRAVKIVGNDLIGYADNLLEANAEVVGLMFETIITGNSGKIVTHGIVPAGKVSGFISGDEIYLDSSNGQLTNIPPLSGVIVYIGKYNNGKVYLNISQGILLS